MSSAEMRRLEIRTRALDLEMRLRRVELERLSATTHEAEGKRSRSTERFERVKDQLLQLRQGADGSSSLGATTHEAKSLAAKLICAGKSLREDTVLVQSLYEQTHVVQSCISRGEHQLEVLNELSCGALQKLMAAQQEEQSQEVIEIAARNGDKGGSAELPSAPCDSTACANLPFAGERSAHMTGPALTVHKRGVSKQGDSKIRDIRSVEAQASPASDQVGSRSGAFGELSYSFDRQLQSFDRHLASPGPRQLDEQATGSGATRRFSEALSPSLSGKIQALQSWENLAGQGVEFAIQLQSGNRLEVEVSANQGGAVQVLLQPERSRDRYALWRRRSEIEEALTTAGCQVRGVTVRGRSSCLG